jgi:hypothetical protein
MRQASWRFPCTQQAWHHETIKALAAFVAGTAKHYIEQAASNLGGPR